MDSNSLNLRNYHVSEFHKRQYSDRSYLIVDKIIELLGERDMTYEQAKEALELTDQVLLNKVLRKTIISHS